MCSDRSRDSRTLCAYPSCNKRVWQDPDGSYSAYCSNGHRLAMAQLPYAGDLVCRQCNSRPCYIENGYTHPYCGKRCAAAARNGTPASRSPSVVSTSSECRLARCRNPVFVDRNGIPSQFCSNRHRVQAVESGSVEGCLFCSQNPKMVEGNREMDFCSRKCKDDATRYAPIILEVPPNHKAFENVSTQFRKQWSHTPDSVPRVLKVYKIFCEPQIMDKFSRYRLKLQRKSAHKDANERRRFHGTARTCRLGDDDNSVGMCNDQACSLCQIIKSSFELAAFGTHTNFGRFGAGIYTSATSSKANDYVRELGGSPYRSMLLNKVIMGNPIKLYEDDQTLVQPPDGYDSVVGEPGTVLNYDECIVYTNDAIRPAFLIIYE